MDSKRSGSGSSYGAISCMTSSSLLLTAEADDWMASWRAWVLVRMVADAALDRPARHAEADAREGRCLKAVECGHLLPPGPGRRLTAGRVNPWRRLVLHVHVERSRELRAHRRDLSLERRQLGLHDV